jgi:hypothetical protein
MKNIVIEKSYPGDYRGLRPTEKDYDLLLNETATVLKPDGSLLCVLIKNAIPKEQIATAWRHLKKYNPKTDNRGTATGVEMVHRTKKDGTLSNTLKVPKGMEVTSGVIGFYDRYPRIPFCRKCSWNAENPEGFAEMLPLFQQVDKLYAEHAPDYYAAQKEIAARTSKDFKIPETVFTTITVNKNFRTAVHKDAKNFDAVAPMLLIREGKYSGGYVVFPEYRVAAAMDTGDIIIFRNMVDWHGNTQIIPLSKNYQRCTMVFYYREGMINCGTAEQELERAKRRQRGDKIQSDNLNELNEGE